MSISVQNNSRNLSSIYRYNNFQNIKTAFSCELNKASTIISNNATSSVNAVNYGEDDEQTLIEDQKLYELEQKYGYLKDVEFGSIEWNQWKTEHTDSFFPPLDAPAVVRQAFREVRENIPEDDKKAQKDFVSQNLLLFCKVHNPDKSNLPNNFRLNTPSDYEQFLNWDINQNNYFAQIGPTSEKDLYLQAAKLDQQINNKLHEILFGL